MTEDPKEPDKLLPPQPAPPLVKRRFEQVIRIRYTADEATNALGVPWWIVFADAMRSLSEGHAVFVTDANPHIEDITVMSEFRAIDKEN